MAVDVRDDVVVMVVPEIPRCSELSVKYVRTAFVDAVDRGHATGATLEAHHAALDY